MDQIILSTKFEAERTMKSPRRLRIITYLDVVATVDVLTANSNDVNLVEPRNVLYANICLPPEKPCDIAFFLSVL